MSVLNYVVIDARNRMARAKEGFREFLSSEKGVSNVVATIIVLLIVVIVIGVFWDRLSGWLSGIMDSIFGADLPTEGDLGGS